MIKGFGGAVFVQDMWVFRATHTRLNDHECVGPADGESLVAAVGLRTIAACRPLI